jgi:DNA-directed RNA polymerase specialized sigma24 family protein
MRLHEFTTKQELDEIGVGLAARYLAKRIAQAASASRKGPPKPDEAITKKAPETISQNKQAAQQRIDQHYGGKPQLVQSPKPSNNPGTIKSLQTTSSKRPMPASTKQPANEATKSKGDLADEMSDMLYMLRKAKEAGDLVKVEQLKQKINKIKKQLFEPVKEGAKEEFAKQKRYAKLYNPDGATYGKDEKGTPQSMPTLDKFEYDPLDPGMPSDAVPMDDYQKNQLEKIIKSSLIELTPQQRKVIILRFGLLGYEEHTRKQVARIIERSYERITQLENDALRKLRLLRSPELRQARADISTKSYNDDSIQERKLSKKEVKTRDKYADDLPDKEFKKRYGKDWESVKYATATKMAKKKNESTGDKDVANYVSETDTKIS